MSPKTSLNEEFDRHNERLTALLGQLHSNIDQTESKIETELNKHRREIGKVLEANPA